MSVKVSVEVVRHDGLPYREGNAVVIVDGQVVAKLRSCEGIEITIPDPTYSVSVTAPHGLNDAPPCEALMAPGSGRTCDLPRGHAGGHRVSYKVAARPGTNTGSRDD